ncbi:MAG TPA: uroporphyrinogen-III synthase [Hyphomicrobiaceae bacterium]|nr:uroporphyrinogen-III synthase [Hyphomicrobiaceae bacterium]
MRILVTRAAEDAAALATRLEALGHTPVIAPLLEVAYLPEALDLGNAKGLIVTSRYALEALAREPAALAAACRRTIYCVGESTGQRARELGAPDVVAGPGTASRLIGMIRSQGVKADGPLLYLSAKEVAVDIAGELRLAGLDVRRQTVYRMVAVRTFKPAVARDLADGRIEAVILMSQRTARIYVELMSSAGLGVAARRVHHLCLSPSVAAALAPLGGTLVAVAAHPTLDDLLTLIPG